MAVFRADLDETLPIRSHLRWLRIGKIKLPFPDWSKFRIGIIIHYPAKMGIAVHHHVASCGGGRAHERNVVVRGGGGQGLFMKRIALFELWAMGLGAEGS